MDEHAYFRAIEERFIALRGAPLLLSPADFQVAKRWWGEGVPLAIVENALAKVFERRAERGDDRPIQSLRYCSSAVEAAWKRAGDLEQAGRRQASEPIEIGPRLSKLAAAIPEALPGAAELKSELVALEGTAEEVEAALSGLDTRMLAAVEATLSDEERAELGRRLESGLDPLRGRMASAEIAAAGKRLFEQALRRERGLPVLSLFSR